MDAGMQPSARHSHAAASAGGRVYVHGGAAGFNVCTGEVHVLDLQARAWTLLDIDAGPVHSCYSHAMSVERGILVLVGGCPSNHAGMQHAGQLGL